MASVQHNARILIDDCLEDSKKALLVLHDMLKVVMPDSDGVAVAAQILANIEEARRSVLKSHGVAGSIPAEDGAVAGCDAGGKSQSREGCGAQAIPQVVVVPSSHGWMQITDDDRPPKDINLLLYCPDRHFTNPERVECGWYGSSTGGWLHPDATHWQYPPPFPTLTRRER